MHLRGMGQDFHALAERSGARLDQAAALAQNLNGADAARSPGTQQRLVAEIGHFDAGHAGGFENDGPGGNGHFLPVDFAGDHLLLGTGSRHHWFVVASSLRHLATIVTESRCNPAEHSVSTACTLVAAEPGRNSFHIGFDLPVKLAHNLAAGV